MKFFKKNGVKPVVTPKQDESTSEEKIKYEWSEGASIGTNLRSIALLATVIPNALIGLSIIAYYGAWALCWYESTVLILLSLIVICWLISWFGNLKHVLVSAQKAPMLMRTAGMVIIALWLGLCVQFVGNGSLSISLNVFTAEISVFIFGSHIGFDFLDVYLRYRSKISGYRTKPYSFIEFCNMPKTGN